MRNYGRLAEWSKAAVLKTVDVQASGGSNPSPSASATSSGLKRYKKEHAPACSCFCIAYCLALRFAANSGIEMVTLAKSAYERRSLFRRHASPGSLRIPRLPPTLRAVARGDPKKGAWHKCRSLFCFAPCLALRSATTSCIEMVTTHSVRLFRPRVARPYESLAFRQTIVF